MLIPDCIIVNSVIAKVTGHVGMTHAFKTCIGKELGESSTVCTCRRPHMSSRLVCFSFVVKWALARIE
jgi:hypothetical protein